ncbi:MAG: hypothetical protein M1281_00585 [Chloroflexi bacterium]|nr:hypothetical protein [Chloroflexota bacterium]
MFGKAWRLIILTLLIGVCLQPAYSAQAAEPVKPMGANQSSAGGTGILASAATFNWYNGLTQYSTITNCASIIQGAPYQENGVGTYVGFYADPNGGYPGLNDTYYLHVVVGGLGNACSGMRAYIDLALPDNTSPAIDSTNKVFCLYDGVAITPASDCPQSLPASTYNSGMLEIPAPSTSDYSWPIPQGHILEIQIPVRSTAALSNSPFQAKVWVLDGNSSPWLQPQQGVYVFSSTPTILYPSPATTTITTSTGHSEAYLYTYGIGGTGYFDLGTTTSYSLVHEPVAIAAGGNAYLAWDDWGPPPLDPDTLYHWRFTFSASNGQTYYGADQTFRTLPTGRATVGSGIASSCTEAALSTALGTAQEVTFDCGLIPVTIPLTGATSISSNVSIDGGNTVTLDANNAAAHFDVSPGAHLTLTKINLINGKNDAGCGGSIHVSTNAQLTLNEARFSNNATSNRGGAICIEADGSADIHDSLFEDNTSLAGGAIYNQGNLVITHSAFTTNTAGGHGGAIQAYGPINLSDSTFTTNSAGGNGGAIDTTVDATVTDSTFSTNTAGYRGGGINSYLGVLTVVGSTFTENGAEMYGGGISNDGGPASIQTSTLVNNTAKGNGGGIENSGTLTLTNSTVDTNEATASNGGGIYWSGGSITILNSTIVGNTGAEGGNLYVGGSYNAAIELKNTIISAGSPNNCDSTVKSNGYNLEDADSCGLTSTSDRASTNPMLGPLQDNRGTTLTRLLLPGSPAIDAGTNTGCPAIDQRGDLRPIDGNHDGLPVCDIGAVEVTSSTIRIFLPLTKR